MLEVQTSSWHYTTVEQLHESKLCEKSDYAHLRGEWMPQTQKGYIRYAVYLASGKVTVAASIPVSSKFDLVEQACSDLHQSYQLQYKLLKNDHVRDDMQEASLANIVLLF